MRELQGDREVRRGLFTVNLLSAEESNIAPRDLPADLSGGQANQPAATSARARHELWRALLAIGLAILALEWWVYYRGGGAARLARPRWRWPRPRGLRLRGRVAP